MKNLISELKRRNVFKVAAAYAIAGWLIIQICATTFPFLQLPDYMVTAVIVFTLAGFPVSIIVAWAFELTPDGLKKSQEVDITESVTKETGKKLNGIIITVLSMALVFVLIERVFFARSSIIDDVNSEISAASIAVMPFVNMSGDASNEYFSDGLSEELLNGLAKLDGLQVAGRTSSFQFKGTNPDLRDVGKQLGVKHILEGSVRKEGNRVRVTAQLIQSDNGFHLWSDTFDRELTATDIFDIQEEITRQVVQQLKLRLLPEEEGEISERPTQDIEAYNAYLEATQLEVNRRADEIEAAIKKYEEAVRLDPTFSLAYARLAYAYVLLNSYGDIQFDEAKYLTRKNIDQALLLDKDQGKAYQAMSLYYRDFERDEEKAIEAGLKAVELLPNDPLAINALVLAYAQVENDDEVSRLQKRAYEIDPLNPVIAGNYILDLAREEKFDEAIELSDQLIKRYPDYSTAVVRKENIISNAPFGQLDEGFKILYERYKERPDDYFILLRLYYRSRDLDLIPLTFHFEKEINKYYPNNRLVKNLGVQTSLINKDYEEVKARINSILDEFGNESEEDFLYAYSQIYYKEGRIDEYLRLEEKYEPELTRENPVIDHTFDGASLRYSRLLELDGQTERAEKIKNLSLASLRLEQRKSEEEGREIDALFTENWISLNTKDYDRYLEIFEKLYFEMKAKPGWVVRLRSNGIYRKDLEKIPEYLELEKRIFDDIHAMRANVIDYLKAEGDWKEEWGEGN